MKKTRAWWVIVKDDDRNLFNVIGPVTDDTHVTDRVCEEQKRGRGIRCETISSDRGRDQVIESWAKASGQKFTERLLIIP